VEDLTQLALKLFEIEKKFLLDEKQEYSCSIVIVITPEGRYYEDVEFNDETEMDGAFGAIVERAKSKKATAIITISTVRVKDVADESELESYWWGKLAAENQPRCLFLTISGPNLKSTWTITALIRTVPIYLRNGIAEIHSERRSGCVRATGLRTRLEARAARRD
jgi:hypothetical protein